MKAVVILSGGLDSTILTYKVVNELGAGNVTALSFNYGQKQALELERAAITCKRLNIVQNVIDLRFMAPLLSNVCANISGSTIDVPDVEDILGNPQPVTYVPNRNALMLNIAISVAEALGAQLVYIGLQCHDLYGYWDTTPQFVEAINNVSRLNREHKIAVVAPFINMSKADELKIGEQLHVPYGDTWTCYDPVQRTYHTPEQAITEPKPVLACGKCGSCAERLRAFEHLGLTDPLEYAK